MCDILGGPQLLMSSSTLNTDAAWWRCCRASLRPVAPVHAVRVLPRVAIKCARATCFRPPSNINADTSLLDLTWPHVCSVVSDAFQSFANILERNIGPDELQSALCDAMAGKMHAWSSAVRVVSTVLQSDVVITGGTSTRIQAIFDDRVYL